MIFKFPLSLAVLLLLASADEAHGSFEGAPEDWYKVYPVYPEYCSTIEQMNNRKIPPLLVSDSLTGGSQLQHVTVITRHGARTPSGPVRCWEGYLENPDTSVWDCDLTSLKAPLPEAQILHLQGLEGGSASDTTLNFNVKYDALVDHDGDAIANVLQGTCMAGQLIMRGHQQLQQTGELLREAYVFDSSWNETDGADTRLQLLDVNVAALDPWDESNLHFRSTDKQRTILSGQTLLRSMYQPEIDAYYDETRTYPAMVVHTADIDNDIMLPSMDLCPRLAEVVMAPDETPVSKAEEGNTTEELIMFIDQVLGGDVDHFEIDCLMTTICSDRPLPDAINDYAGGTPDNGYFQQLVDLYTDQYVSMFRKNGAAFSKLAMGPLWLELMSNFNAFTVDGQEETCCPTRPRSKFSLYVGHDLTLMPFLASLGLLGDEWATYAAAIVIELHEIGIDAERDDTLFGTNHAFRLLYNGEVLTPEIEGCPEDSDLCDFQVLVDLIASFATNFEDCAMTAPTAETEEDDGSAAEAELVDEPILDGGAMDELAEAPISKNSRATSVDSSGGSVTFAALPSIGIASLSCLFIGLGWL